MSYVKSVLQPDERLRYVTHIHWCIFLPAIGFFVLSALVLWFAAIVSHVYNLWHTVALVLFICGLVTGAHAWFRRFTTEIAVTDRRIIYKRGFISLQSVEMQMDKVESVDVTQSVLGRLLGYGDVIIRGVGAGMEPLLNISSPVDFRNHVTGE